MSKFSTRRFIAAGFVGMSAFALAACSSSPPTEAELKEKMMEAAPAVPGVDMDALADCMAKGLTEKMSEDGRSALMDAADASGSGLSAEDQQALTDVSTECATELATGS